MSKEYTITIKVREQCFEDEDYAKTQMKNDIYRVAAAYFEVVGEHSGFLYGNGHHAAQEIAKRAADDWELRSKTKKQNAEA